MRVWVQKARFWRALKMAFHTAVWCRAGQGRIPSREQVFEVLPDVAANVDAGRAWRVQDGWGQDAGTAVVPKAQASPGAAGLGTLGKWLAAHIA